MAAPPPHPTSIPDTKLRFNPTTSLGATAYVSPEVAHARLGAGGILLTVPHRDNNYATNAMRGPTAMRGPVPQLATSATTKCSAVFQAERIAYEQLPTTQLWQQATKQGQNKENYKRINQPTELTEKGQSADNVKKISANSSSIAWKLEHFVGEWNDSLGNAVEVDPRDVRQGGLVATLSKASRRDVHLKIRRTPEGKWLCGNATLLEAASTERRLLWQTEDGRRSIWSRPYFNVGTESDDGLFHFIDDEEETSGSDGSTLMANAKAAAVAVKEDTSEPHLVAAKANVVRLSF
eukprot:TRINITY_DN11839_c0_g1_i3.p1 TRINITY_DN11839_c0_g1~~TRINITY_DN11839_c0_g1_i3.p1  ORF type:complete len:293 (+),score=41.09 TRINITY_DN11839_c0_g1_i3:109-987(+)